MEILSAQNVKAPPGDAPFVVHVVHRLSIGGLETVVVNLVNHIPASRFRHAIVSLTDITEFASRIQNPDIMLMALHKRPGKDFPAYFRLWRLLREIRPDIVFTHSLATLDVQLYAALAGVPGHIHAEHGQFSSGMGKAPSLLRRITTPLIHHYSAVSRDLSAYLTDTLRIPASRVSQIYNCVDTDRFRPERQARRQLGPPGFLEPDSLAVGAVGRMEPVKDQPTLVRAFISLAAAQPELRRRLRLVLVGGGSLREQCIRLIQEAGLEESAWVPGDREDIPEILRALDVFVLPSISEGTSTTILEAMASGLPVVATRVGGNPELIQDGRTGMLVPSQNPAAIAEAIALYARDPALRSSHGDAARSEVLGRFALKTMIEAYSSVYERVLAQTGGNRPRAG